MFMENKTDFSKKILSIFFKFFKINSQREFDRIQ